MMIWHLTRLFLADLLALAIVAGVILLSAAAWQYAWSADTGKGCETATLMLLADRERARQTYRRDCLEASGDQDNPFAKLMCEPPP